jgi:integrase
MNNINPRFIRQRNAPQYLGLSEPIFNKEVRPYVTIIRMGRAIFYDRLDLDAWADRFKIANGMPGKFMEIVKWQNQPLVSEKKVQSGILTKQSQAGKFEKALAERYLTKRIEEIRAEVIYGKRKERTFDDAAERYIEDFGHKKSLDRDIDSIKAVFPYIGSSTLKQIHSASLERFIQDRQAANISAGTLNRDLAVIKRILRLCVLMWRDDEGRPWLDTAPLLQTIHGTKRKPRPISVLEQERLIIGMPEYLEDMAIFALHTGLREQEICSLQWLNERQIFGTPATVFVITGERAKNSRERIVPLNSVARAIVEKYRGQSDFVFHLKGKRLERMNNRAWRKARTSANLADVRVHDLRHTFGMRLRAAGVSFEDRQDLLGHHAGRITTHYSKVEITKLIKCVEMLCDDNYPPELTLVKVT